MFNCKSVVKRDGRIVKFNSEKIWNAINSALAKVQSELRDYSIAESQSLDSIVSQVKEKLEFEIMKVEDIQDIVERILIEDNLPEIAKEYIIYRNERNKIREVKSDLMKTMKELTFADSIDIDLKRENGNVDANTAMGTMLKYGSEVSKKFYISNLINPKYSYAHTNGDIHIHDLDFMALTMTCCQIDIKKLLKNGFSTGHGHLREPNDILSAAALTCIAIQSNQNDMHGGQAIPNFDYGLEEYVAKTYIKSAGDFTDEMFSPSDIAGKKTPEGNSVRELLKKVYNQAGTLLGARDTVKMVLKSQLSNSTLKSFISIIEAHAYKSTITKTHQAMEALIHNLNTMNSRAGAQTPFSSINYGTCTSEEGRLVIKSILQATEEGLGNGEIPIFPIQIFKVKEDVNYYPTDINYDLFDYACKVSAKRLFPNFSFIDSEFNKKYYKEGKPETEIAYMGCVSGNSIVTYKFEGNLYIEPIEKMWDRTSKEYGTKNQGISEYVETYPVASIYDSASNSFVRCDKVIRNPNMNNWYKIVFDNGTSLICTEDHPLPVITNIEKDKTKRTMVKDISVGNKIPIGIAQLKSTLDPDLNIAWLKGALLAGEHQNGKVIYKKYKNIPAKALSRIKYILKSLGNKSSIEITDNEYIVHLGLVIEDSTDFDVLTSSIFRWNNMSKYAFLAGYIDMNSKEKIYSRYLNKDIYIIGEKISDTLKGQIRTLLDTLNVQYDDSIDAITVVPDSHLTYNLCDFEFLMTSISAEEHVDCRCYRTVVSIEKVDYDGYSYDVTTSSDRFDVNGINSHNCRTRTIGNIYDKDREIVYGRGNLSFTTVNLPRLGIESMLRYPDDKDKRLSYFFDSLKYEVNLVFDQLLERLKYQSMRKVKNFPFLMGQGVWIDSDKLGTEDSVAEVIKHGSLTVGFIGLAETLIALTGKHHGESEESQNLGLKIIGTMRKMCDSKSEETNLNFALMATPAEGLSSRFTKLDKVKYGIIDGITDKEFYTNSFHIPVYYNIDMYNKLRLEAPYHALTNGGHISYVEYDGDPTENIEAFKSIVRMMHDAGIGYGAINHAVDHCTVCGYTGVINDECPICGNNGTDGVSMDRLMELSKKYSFIKIPKKYD